MRRIIGILLAQTAVGCLIAATTLSMGRAAQVITIQDGNTILVEDNSERILIRLACIDAPEIGQDPYGSEARHYLYTLIPPSSKVTLRLKAITKDQRMVAEVFKDGENINMKMVEAGHAMIREKYIKKCDSKTYARLEQSAKNAKIGIWGSSDSIEKPWQFRLSHPAYNR